MKKHNQSIVLWWVGILALSVGIATFILLEPEYSDYKAERIRNAALLISIIIPGFCLIIGTRRRWFGKGL